jgi:hypothetical protein
MSFIVGGLAAAGTFGTATVGGVAAGASIGAMIGSTLSGAFGAQTEQEAENQKILAKQIQEEQMQLLGEDRALSSANIHQQFDVAEQQYGLAGEKAGIARQQAGLGLSRTQSQYASGMEDIGTGVGMGMRGIQQSTAAAAGGSGFARSGTVEQQAKIQTGDLMAKYKSDTQKLFEGKQFAAKQSGLEMQDIGLESKAAGQQYEAAGKRTMLAKEEIDLAYKKGRITAEDAYEATVADIDAQPTGWVEGLFS